MNYRPYYTFIQSFMQQVFVATLLYAKDTVVKKLNKDPVLLWVTFYCGYWSSASDLCIVASKMGMEMKWLWILLLSNMRDKNSSLLSKGTLSNALYIHQDSIWNKYLSS